MESKRCSKCGQLKPLSEYYSYWKGRKGLQARCKRCVGEKNKRFYLLNRERYHEQRADFRSKNRKLVNKRARESYWKVKMEVFQAYGNKCACCGESEPIFLELDHIQNDGWQRQDKSAQSLYRQVRTENYPKDKYQLLCANCNQGKRRNNGVCPHKAKGVKP